MHVGLGKRDPQRGWLERSSSVQVHPILQLLAVEEL